jgi:hypothetical protein
MHRGEESGRSCFIVILQIENIGAFRKRRPEHVVRSLFRELASAVRVAVHPSQFVGEFCDGVGLVFDAVDAGYADTISQRLVAQAQHVIRLGKYNDLASQWTDVISQFLFPNKPGMLFPSVGWAVCPRDGTTPRQLINRALHHADEMRNRKAS